MYLNKSIAAPGNERLPGSFNIESAHLRFASLNHADCRAVVRVPVSDLDLNKYPFVNTCERRES